jgi:hypothetical protein
VIFSSILFASKLKLSSSTSTNTGFALCFERHDADAKNVKGEVITSLPSLKPSMSEAITRASVPEATPMAYFAPVYFLWSLQDWILHLQV